VDEGLSVDAIYLDFKKAFDKVPHGMSKVRGCGVDGKEYNWINNWLNGREQRVVINGIHSDWCAVLSGIPQGSILGPLLFVIYVNDIDININNVILKFVDDTKIFAAVADSNDVELLRSDLRRLYEWSYDWLMFFNIDKCKVLHFGSNNAKYDYMLGDQVLDSVSIERNPHSQTPGKMRLCDRIFFCIFCDDPHNIAIPAYSRIFFTFLRKFDYFSPYFLNMYVRYA